MSKSPLLLVHLLGVALSVGSVLILDLRLATLLLGRRVNSFDVKLIELLTPLVRIGLALLWLSGLGFLAYYSFYDPHLLANPKLHAKILIVVLLTINGIVVEKFCLPAVMRNKGRPFFACLNLLERSEVIAVAAISAVSWYFVVALGVVKELNFAVGAVSILEVYGLLLAAAIVAGVAIVWILPGRAGAIAAMLPRASLPPHMGRKRQRRSEPQIADMPSHVIGCARSAFIGVGAFSLIINLLMLTTSLYMMQIFDRVLSGQSRQTLLYLSIIAIMAVAMLGTLDLIRSRILSRIGSWVERSLSCAVYLKGLDNALIGRPYRTEALRDLGAVRSFLSTAGILALFDAPWVPVYLGMVYLLNPLLGHIALAGAILLVGLAYATDRFTAGILKQAKVASGAGLRHAESTFRNAEVIHGMGMGQALAKLWQGLNKEAIALGEAASDRGGMISASSKFLRLALQIVVLGAGAVLVLDHQLTAGGMIAASIIMGRALAPVEQSVGTWKHTVAARNAWQRLCELLRQRPLHVQAITLPRPIGHLTIEGVTYCPPGCTEPVLRGLTLEARPGEVLAITGPSAAGKSTLARLIVGLARPQAGAIRLDGAEVGSLDRRHFGRYIGYLPQDVELFPGSVYRNIARMTSGTPSEVIEAAHLAGVHEMILRLPMGYDTEIGEQGSALSGGQRQRIALARAIYGEPVLLVMDEPNASLDTAGEDALARAIQSLKQRRSTVIVIAHRPGLLNHADRIAVLNGGRLDMIGARDEVMARIATSGPARRGPAQVRMIR
ncbi:MAG TPA: type I secretion system permease/ATPase [Aestuariivirgaceae bacterium]|nr:type I secretion system permease/ATPase [Aestuariivirgaceae bacterium]